MKLSKNLVFALALFLVGGCKGADAGSEVEREILAGRKLVRTIFMDIDWESKKPFMRKDVVHMLPQEDCNYLKSQGIINDRDCVEEDNLKAFYDYLAR